MKEFYYNYVFFNSPEGNRLKRNPNGYFTICSEDLEKDDRTIVVSQPLDTAPYLLRFLYAVHHAERINQKIRLPFKRIWYPLYFKNTFKNNKPMCFIIHSTLPFGYFKYLKKNYPGCKLVLLHRDLAWVCDQRAPGLSRNPILDLELSIDKGESEKFGFIWFSEFESKIDVKPAEKQESGVFFAGKAKDRLPLLMDIYHRLTKAGIDCQYYLVGVPKEQQIPCPGIVYSDKLMPYREMLEHTVNTGCVLEVNQEGADGFTSRFLEAVMFNKKLVTNNLAIKDNKFYNSDKIQLFRKAEEIDIEFVRKGSKGIDYHYNNEFSPLRMIEKVDEELVKKFGTPQK